MKTLRSVLGWLLWLALPGAGWAQTVQYSTPNPRVDDVNDRDVVINRVDLTEQHTIFYMTFRARLRIGYNSSINFVPESRLYANGGARSFRFIRAENIPTTQRRGVVPGDVVEFMVVFERLDPGIEVFDLFECSDRNRPGSTCFNFWGVHVRNPKQRSARRDTKPQPDISKRNTTPPARPRYVPRTTPGYGNGEPDPAPPVQAPATPAPDVAMAGVVRDAKTQQPLAAQLRFQMLSGAESSGDVPADSLMSDGQTGRYRQPGQALSVYAVAVTAKGYLPKYDTLTLLRSEVSRDFALTPIVKGATLTLRNIYFDQSKYDLRPESFPELDRLAQVMQDNPTMTIRLEGHTDLIGNFDANVELSRNRVQAVRQYLIAKGIAGQRIETVGYGPARPIKTGGNKPHPENRRVELVITSA